MRTSTTRNRLNSKKKLKPDVIANNQRQNSLQTIGISVAEMTAQAKRKRPEISTAGNSSHDLPTATICVQNDREEAHLLTVHVVAPIDHSQPLETFI
ncbi:hypothetical protein EVAR_55751_1 [Eumeta japonica]|uniref:Uncharacterized protein n=1 Tax=Eumeta variegata TaxID=151549 RepID=A0A4C1XA36_EUMVA|nr:hypothetical protein EVAR_55751_1 [Eumeta japonica]